MASWRCRRKTSQSTADCSRLGLPRAWFETALNDLPVIVACRSGRVVGYLVTAFREATHHVPVIAAMLRAYPGTLDSYVYSPG